MPVNVIAFDDDIKKDLAKDCYYNKDYFCAASILADLSFNDDVKATENLIYLYLRGLGVQKNVDLAISLSEKLFYEMKEIKGASWLADIYYFQPGYRNLAQSFKLTEYLSRESIYPIKNGYIENEYEYTYVDALNGLGWFYKEGYVVKKDLNKALNLFQKAVKFMEEEGNVEYWYAYTNLGKFYFFGNEIVDQDIDKDLFLQANVGGKWIILYYIE